MLRSTFAYLLIALIAAVFGFTGIAAHMPDTVIAAKSVFWIFLTLCVMSLPDGDVYRSIKAENKRLKEENTELSNRLSETINTAMEDQAAYQRKIEELHKQISEIGIAI